MLIKQLIPTGINSIDNLYDRYVSKREEENSPNYLVDYAKSPGNFMDRFVADDDEVVKTVWGVLVQLSMGEFIYKTSRQQN